MRVGLKTVSKLIVITGSLTLDGITYTDEVDCRELTGEHELVVDGEFDFRSMTQEDYEYIERMRLAKKDEEILNLQAEVVELEYQKALEVIEHV